MPAAVEMSLYWGIKEQMRMCRVVESKELQNHLMKEVDEAMEFYRDSFGESSVLETDYKYLAEFVGKRAASADPQPAA